MRGLSAKLSATGARLGARRSSATIALVVCVLGVASCAGDDARGISMVASGERVALVPILMAGNSGWCAEELRKGGCGISVYAPAVTENWGTSEGAGHGKYRATTHGMLVATRSVAAIAIEKLRLVSSHPVQIRRERWSALGELPTGQESGLPGGLRAVIAEINGIAIPGRHSKNTVVRFVPLNARGQVIRESKARVKLSATLPVRRVSDPADPSFGVCRIAMTPLAGAFAFGAKVIERAVPVRGLIGHAFTTCASTIYKIGGWRVEAAVLLDAAHPGARPAALPLMKPLPGHSGVFEAWPENGGSVLARRVPGAWLVVSEGRDLAERLLVLEHLHASVHLG